jgi:hypothetical protein
MANNIAKNIEIGDSLSVFDLNKDAMANVKGANVIRAQNVGEVANNSVSVSVDFYKCALLN